MLLGGLVLLVIAAAAVFAVLNAEGVSDSDPPPSQEAGGGRSQPSDIADAALETRLRKANVVLAKYCLDAVEGREPSDAQARKAVTAIDRLTAAARARPDDRLPSGDTVRQVVRKGAEAARSCLPDEADRLEAAVG